MHYARAITFDKYVVDTCSLHWRPSIRKWKVHHLDHGMAPVQVAAQPFTPLFPLITIAILSVVSHFLQTSHELHAFLQ